LLSGFTLSTHIDFDATPRILSAGTIPSDAPHIKQSRYRPHESLNLVFVSHPGDEAELNVAHLDIFFKAITQLCRLA
jgi:hypothetical protein